MANANQPRRHHYVPDAYLRHFTDTGMSAGALEVIDWLANRRWRSAPRAIGYLENHFAALDADGKPTSTLVEELRAKVEGDIAPAFARAAHGEADPATIAAVTMLGALMHVGAPRMRTVTTMALEQAMATGRVMQAAFRAGHGSMPPVVAGTDDPPGIALADLERALVENGVHNQFAAFGLDGLPLVLAYLARRSWTLFVAAPDAGQFLTSDAPVICDWAVTPPPEGLFGPSIADSRTVVLLPLSKYVVAMGWGERSVGRMVADREFVATLNFAQVRALTRQAYLPPGDVPCWSLGQERCIVDARAVADEAQQLRNGPKLGRGEE